MSNVQAGIRNMIFTHYKILWHLIDEITEEWAGKWSNDINLRKFSISKNKLYAKYDPTTCSTPTHQKTNLCTGETCRIVSGRVDKILWLIRIHSQTICHTADQTRAATCWKETSPTECVTRFKYTQQTPSICVQLILGLNMLTTA